MTFSTTEAEERIGIERAFDVLRNHTVHTKGYVMTALKVIEEYGSVTDKAALSELLEQKKSLATAEEEPKAVKPKPAAVKSATKTTDTKVVAKRPRSNKAK